MVKSMLDAAELAQSHWNETPLYLSEQERYSTYPWLCEAAEFKTHGGERVLEIGCGTGADLLQFAKYGAVAVGIDLTAKHVELARERVGAVPSPKLIVPKKQRKKPKYKRPPGEES